jgi:hypothetical protein
VGAISVSGASPKAEGPALDALVAMLTEAGRYVSRRLGFSGDLSAVAEASAPAEPRRARRVRA